MSSLLTNTSAMVALTTLRGISDSMAETQNRISTGMRVADASDNAAYWSIATTMRSDNAALSAVQDAIGLGAATVDVAFTAMDNAVEQMKDMVSNMTTATDDTVDKGKIQSALTQFQDQLKTIASSASFSGQNWLQQDMVADNLNKEITGSFTRDANGNVTIETISVDTSSIVLVDTNGTTDNGILSQDLMGAGFDVAKIAIVTAGDMDTLTIVTGTEVHGLEAELYKQAIIDHYNTLTGTAATTFNATDAKALFFATGANTVLGQEMEDAFNSLGGNSVLDFDISGLGTSGSDKKVLQAVIHAVDGQLQSLTDAATDLGSAKARVDMQMEFVKNLTDAIDRGVGQLVDADMNAESTRLKALQTQEQLGIQALSIANAGSENILSLFR
ncbi:Flagellin [Pseudovibrio axinellae]|uniref:Flagellin n=1 Tax=Pseudovibrio axinellae TaxID=989403 RepID=A0A165XIT7_9HYPH|nr:flagellin [Pseudovibrio axinellae]KZL17750.1 Flagellin [Pseudovibrio axinellae]SEP74125.1 flagellin [Pseudovibrio axinellae]